MKNLVLVLLVWLVSMVSVAQSDSIRPSDSVKTSFGGYVSVGMSLSSGNDLHSNTFASLEGGICRDNFSVGISLGRGNFSGINSTDNIRNYCYEIKTNTTFPLGKLNGNILLGYGGYFNTKNMFI